MILDLSKPVQTRDGRPARIICTDMKTPEPAVVALVMNSSKIESLCYYPISGKIHADSTEDYPSDLVNVPQKHSRWANCYPNGSITGYESKEQADSAAGANRIACIKVEFTEGEGL